MIIEIGDQAYLQWLTTHSLLQYSFSQSGLGMAAFGQPERIQCACMLVLVVFPIVTTD